MLRTTALIALGFASTLLASQAPPPVEAPPAKPAAEQQPPEKAAEPAPAEPKDDKAPAPKGDQASQPKPDQLLRYRYEPGATRKYKVVTTLKTRQSVDGKIRETAVEREDHVTSTVQEIDDKGFAQTRLRIDVLRVNATFDGQAYQFDSRSKERAKGTAIAKSLNPLYERLTGGEYQILLGPQGEVAEVRGYAELLRDVVAANPLAVQMAGGGFNNSARVAAEEQTVVFGNQVVQSGEKWSTPIDLESPSVGRARGQRTWTLVGPDKVGTRETLRLNLATELTCNVVIERAGARVTGTLTTSDSSGVAQFDRTAGVLVSLKSSWKLGGTLTALVDGKSTEIETEQIHGVTVELEK